MEHIVQRLHASTVANRATRDRASVAKCVVDRARSVVATCFLAMAGVVHGAGFAQPDLARADIDLSTLVGGKFVSRMVPDLGQRVLLCEACEDRVSIGMHITAGSVEIERRYRSGETTIEQLQASCRLAAPTCTAKAIEAGAAVGWQLTAAASFGAFVSRGVLMRDGERLTISTRASSRELAEANTDVVVETVAPRIVGD